MKAIFTFWDPNSNSETSTQMVKHQDKDNAIDY